MLAFIASTTQNVYAQGEHGRRAGAELRVVIGDVRHLSILTNSPETAQHRKGLHDRIKGGLSALDILFRLADQEAERTPEIYSDLVTSIGTSVDSQQWDLALDLLVEFEDRFPLKQPVVEDSDVLRSSSKKLHQDLCAGCHDSPAQDVQRPAYNLYRQARESSDTVFYARMLVGVRGDRITGIDNPLSDTEIAGLIYLYKKTQ